MIRFGFKNEQTSKQNPSSCSELEKSKVVVGWKAGKLLQWSGESSWIG